MTHLDTHVVEQGLSSDYPWEVSVIVDSIPPHHKGEEKISYGEVQSQEIKYGMSK
jgi:hypothetical protein